MTFGGERAAAWVYSGVWRAVVACFRVPEGPPRLPGMGAELEAFKPARAFLKYLKLYFWVGLVVIDAIILVPWAMLTVERPVLGLALAPVAWGLAVVPDVLVYVGLHLRYDTTWYLLTDRSLRIRRGIWTIGETTITYENVQNVTVHQGPIQRYFGIATVMVQTAGGGGGGPKGGAGTTHIGLIEGVSDAQGIRDRIMARVRQSRTAGLGDERLEGETTLTRRWTASHIRVLRDIRDAVVQRR